jgi:hypothetical protein
VANLIGQKLLLHVASPCACEAPSSASARSDGRRRLLEPRVLGHPNASEKANLANQ